MRFQINLQVSTKTVSFSRLDLEHRAELKSAEDAWEKRLQTELSRLRHEHEGRARVERKEAERTRADQQFQITQLQQEIQWLLSTREAEERRRERRARASCSTRFRDASSLSSASSSASRRSGRARRNCASLEVSVYKNWIIFGRCVLL